MTGKERQERFDRFSHFTKGIDTVRAYLLSEAVEKSESAISAFKALGLVAENARELERLEDDAARIRETMESLGKDPKDSYVSLPSSPLSLDGARYAMALWNYGALQGNRELCTLRIQEELGKVQEHIDLLSLDYADKAAAEIQDAGHAQGVADIRTWLAKRRSDRFKSNENGNLVRHALAEINGSHSGPDNAAAVAEMVAGALDVTATRYVMCLTAYCCAATGRQDRALIMLGTIVAKEERRYADYAEWNAQWN